MNNYNAEYNDKTERKSLGFEFSMLFMTGEFKEHMKSCHRFEIASKVQTGGQAHIYTIIGISGNIFAPSRNPRMVAKVFFRGDNFTDDDISEIIKREIQLRNLVKEAPEYVKETLLLPVGNHAVVKCNGIDGSTERRALFYPYRIPLIYEKLKEEELLRLAILTGVTSEVLEWLDQNHFSHRDIKPNNLFLDGDRIVIGDFGALSIENYYAKTDIGSEKFKAPEIGRNGADISKADMYSLGVCMYFFLNGITEDPLAELYPNRQKDDIIPDPILGSDELIRIVLKCMAYDPKDRFSSYMELYKALCETEEFRLYCRDKHLPSYNRITPINRSESQKTDDSKILVKSIEDNYIEDDLEGEKVDFEMPEVPTEPRIFIDTDGVKNRQIDENLRKRLRSDEDCRLEINSLYIPELSFYACGIKELRLIGRVVGKEAFNFNPIRRIELTSVERIEEGAFSKTDIEHLVIPNSMRIIGMKAFAYCGHLTKVIIEEGCRKIESRAFSRCSNLTTVKLPASLEVIASDVFEGCPFVRIFSPKDADFYFSEVPKNIKWIVEKKKGGET